MPWVTINVLKGHSRAQKDKLHQSVTEAIVASLDLPREYVRIQIVEMEPEHNSVGGVTVDKL